MITKIPMRLWAVFHAIGLVCRIACVAWQEERWKIYAYLTCSFDRFWLAYAPPTIVQQQLKECVNLFSAAHLQMYKYFHFVSTCNWICKNGSDLYIYADMPKWRKQLANLGSKARQNFINQLTISNKSHLRTKKKKPVAEFCYCSVEWSNKKKTN